MRDVPKTWIIPKKKLLKGLCWSRNVMYFIMSLNYPVAVQITLAKISKIKSLRKEASLLWLKYTQIKKKKIKPPNLSNEQDVAWLNWVTSTDLIKQSSLP